MHLTSAALATALLASTAIADFRVYGGGENQNLDPAGATVIGYFNNAPDCEDANNAILNPIDRDNDASSGGIACDGCDGAPLNWNVDRLELNDDNGNIFEGGRHITMYVNDDGSWTIYDSEDVELGSCAKPDEPQELTCSDVLSAQYLAHIMTCTSDLSVK